MKYKLQELWPLDRRATHALLAVTALVCLFVFVMNLKSIFTPFFLAVLVAYILNPFVNFGETKKIPRWLGTSIVFFVLSLLLLLFVFFVCPSIYTELTFIIQHNELAGSSNEELRMKATDYLSSFSFIDREEALKATVRLKEFLNMWRESQDWARNAWVGISKGVVPASGAVLVIGLNVMLFSFYLFFLLNSLNEIWKYIVSHLVPYEYREQFETITNKVHHSVSAFFRGRLLVCVVIGALAWMGFAFLDVPFAFLLGFGIGFATIIPMFGLVFLVPAVILYFLVGATVMDQVKLLALYTLLQGLEMFILTPILLGREVEIHPVILLLAILICGSLFGVIGVILAVPIASTSKILFYEFIFPSFEALSKEQQ